MKNVEVSGVIEFMGKEMPNLYGGFGVEQKVILAKTIAEIHDIELKDINKLINNNFEEFELGIDILDLKGNGSLQSPLDKLGFSNRDISISKHIYLLSEQGYMLLVGFMRTDKAKEIRKQLRRNYFAMKEVIGKNENLLSVEQSLQLQLFSKDPLDVVNAHKQLVDIKIDEVKPTFIEEGRKVGFTEGFDEGKNVAEEGILLNERNKIFLNATEISKLIGEKLNLPKLRSTNLMMFLEKRNLGRRMAKEGKTYRKFVPNKNFDNIIIKNGWARKTTNGNIEFSIEFSDVIAEYDVFKVEISNCMQDYSPTELNIGSPF